MIEWLWESFFLFVRIFVILSIITMISAGLGWLHAWWNESEDEYVSPLPNDEHIHVWDPESTADPPRCNLCGKPAQW